jgi:hypothetical protein
MVFVIVLVGVELAGNGVSSVIDMQLNDIILAAVGRCQPVPTFNSISYPALSLSVPPFSLCYKLL